MEDAKKELKAQQNDTEAQRTGPSRDDRPEAKSAPMDPGPLGGWIFWAILLGILAAMLYQQQWEAREELPSWAAFRTVVREDGLVEGSVILGNNRIESVLKTDFTLENVKEDTGEELPVYVAIDQQNRDFYLTRLEELDIAWRDETSEVMWPTLLLMFSPLLLLLVLGAWAVARTRKMAESGPAGMFGQFARSQHRVASKDSTTVTLDDVAGVEDAKAEVDELIDFLKHFQRFQDMGARPPRGVLLLGPPGCGKTLLARAIAGEAHVPFFSISGSDFMEMFVGVGASRVRDLFAQAKRSAPCIIFLDEIDSVGRKRGGELNVGGDHSEREQTLNAILSEMDGFEPSDQVMVIAATNRPDVLDPALTRRGRFDRPVTIPLPDVRGRHGILRIHAKQVRLGDDVDLEKLARSTRPGTRQDLCPAGKGSVQSGAEVSGSDDARRLRGADFRGGAKRRHLVRRGRRHQTRHRNGPQNGARMGHVGNAGLRPVRRRRPSSLPALLAGAFGSHRRRSRRGGATRRRRRLQRSGTDRPTTLGRRGRHCRSAAGERKSAGRRSPPVGARRNGQRNAARCSRRIMAAVFPGGRCNRSACWVRGSWFVVRGSWFVVRSS